MALTAAVGVMIAGIIRSFIKALEKEVGSVVSNPQTNDTDTNDNSLNSYPVDKLHILQNFCKFLPNEIYKKKQCYLPCATHLIDQATDIAVIFEFYQLYQFENIPNPNDTINDCANVDGLSLLILSIISFIFYRIISSIWIYNITQSKFHTFLQLLDVKIYHALYINFTSDVNKGKPNAAQTYIQFLEACLESFPQVVIQLYFFIKVQLNISQYWVIFASLIISLYNVSTKINGEDTIHFDDEFQKMSHDDFWLNPFYVFRLTFRIFDVLQRVFSILVIWIHMGGFYCSAYIIMELFILSLIGFFTQEYVLSINLHVFSPCDELNNFSLICFVCANIVYLFLRGFPKHHCKCNNVSNIHKNYITFFCAIA